jgi:TRAP-type C4-dicarboxylate transport system permease small subunit
MTAAAARPLPLRLVGWAETVTRYAAWFAMALLCCAIVISVVDVSTRRTIGWSIPGLVDLTQLFVMSFVYFSIPFGFMREANVSVDFVTDRLSRRGVALVKGVCALLGAAFMAGITWYSWIRAAQQIENGDASQTIGIPFGWYWGPLLAGGALSVVAALLQAWRYLWAAATGRGDAAPPIA